MLLAVGLLVMIVTGLSLGAAPLSLGELWTVVRTGPGGSDGFANPIFWEIRVPRVVLGILLGAGLAVSGACLQAFFRNPLADPVLVGISGGAALGAVMFLALVPAGTLMIFGLSGASFAGGMITTVIIAFMAQVNGRMRAVTFLLCGIAITALTNAGISYCLHLSNDQQLRSIVFWLMGSLGQATWQQVGVAAPLIALSLVALPWLAKPLNALLLGEAEATHLGVPVERVKRLLIVTSAASVGAGVAVCGMVGFVGLMVPHLVRLLVGADHRWLLPGCALMGGALVVGSDVLARVVVAPAELPLGVITAVMGAPFFLWLLLKERGRILW
jgi:iron complex transport system permease protein